MFYILTFFETFITIGHGMGNKDQLVCKLTDGQEKDNMQKQAYTCKSICLPKSEIHNRPVLCVFFVFFFRDKAENSKDN